MRTLLLALALSLCAHPILAQVGGPGGFERAGKKPRGALSVDGFHSAMKMGYARVKQADKALADMAEGEAPHLRYERAVAMGLDAWSVAELCNQALYSDVLAKSLEEAGQMANAEPGIKLKTYQKDFEQCIAEMREVAIAALGVAVDASQIEEGRDEVLFNLGYYQALAGKSGDGAATMKRLLADYPTSDYAAEAWLMIGEYLFEQNQMKEALKTYGKLDQYTSSRVRPYGKYKSAWALYNLQEFEKAYKAMVVAMDMCGPGSPWHHLYKEILKDISLFYASTEGFPEEALDAFKGMDKDMAPTMAERLAAHYLDSGKTDEALNVLESLVEAYPDSPRLLEYRCQQVMVVASAAGDEAVIGVVELLAETYAQQTKDFPPHAKQALPRIEGVLEELIADYRLQANRGIPGATETANRLMELRKQMTGK